MDGRSDMHCKIFCLGAWSLTGKFFMATHIYIYIIYMYIQHLYGLLWITIFCNEAIHQWFWGVTDQDMSIWNCKSTIIIDVTSTFYSVCIMTPFLCQGFTGPLQGNQPVTRGFPSQLKFMESIWDIPTDPPTSWSYEVTCFFYGIFKLY